MSSKLRGGKACCVAGTGAGGTLIVVFVSSLWLQDGQVLSFRVFESVNYSQAHEDMNVPD